MGKDDLDQAGKSARTGRSRPAAKLSVAKLSAVVLAASLCMVGTATASFGAAARTRTAMTGIKRADTTSGFLACEVTDTGGINDRSFNASAYQGLKVAAAAIPGLTYRYLGSTSTSDYTPNINEFIGEKCGIIVTVGFDMADATQTAAEKNPTQKFTIVDDTYTPTIKNILGLYYATNQDAFMGGYLAAAMSKSGIIGTFGGQNIPPVTIYMDGWVAGARYYNKLNHAHVKVLGWTPKPGRPADSLAGSGVFTNDFTNEALGKTDTQTLIGEGADIIFPVAGSVGLGAAAAVKEADAGHYMEWVDTDGCISAPQYCSLFITSVTKGIVASVSNAVEKAAKGTFHGGNYTGDLADNGVALAPFHDFSGVVPATVKSELNKIKAGIVAGTISVDPNSYPAS
jgi:basic membrane protein A and related proteins